MVFQALFDTSISEWEERLLGSALMEKVPIESLALDTERKAVISNLYKQLIRLPESWQRELGLQVVLDGK